MKPYREHILFILLSLFVGGFAQNRKLSILVAGLFLLFFILFVTFKLGSFDWIVGFLSSALASGRISSDKRLIFIIFFTVLGFFVGLFFSRRKKKAEDTNLKGVE